VRFGSGPEPKSGPTQRTRRFGRRPPWPREDLLRAAASAPWLTGRQCPSSRVSSPMAHGPSVCHHAPTVSSPRAIRVSSPESSGSQFPDDRRPTFRAGVSGPARGPSRPYVGRVRVHVRDVRRRRAYGGSGTWPGPAAAVQRRAYPGPRPAAAEPHERPHQRGRPASSGPDPGPRHRHWGLLALAIENLVRTFAKRKKSLIVSCRKDSDTGRP